MSSVSTLLSTSPEPFFISSAVVMSSGTTSNRTRSIFGAPAQ